MPNCRFNDKRLFHIGAMASPMQISQTYLSMRKGARCDIQVHEKSETTGVTKCCRPSKNFISNEVFDTCAICGYGSRLKKKNNFLVTDRASVQQGVFINMWKMKCADSGGGI